MLGIADSLKKFSLTAYYLARKKFNFQMTRRRFMKTINEFRLDSDIETYRVFSQNSAQTFKSLCDKYNSDKGSLNLTKASYPWPAHTYATIYSLIFEHSRLSIRSVFECGIGPITKAFQEKGIRTRNASSLSIWEEYFPNAKIFGADIDRESLVSNDRIQSFELDQTDVKLVTEFWRKNEFPEFDVMIDDGLHSYDAITVFFEASIHKLNENGTYIIEDVHSDDLGKLKTFLTQFDLQTQFILGSISEKMNNNLIIIRKNLR